MKKICILCACIMTLIMGLVISGCGNNKYSIFQNLKIGDYVYFGNYNDKKLLWIVLDARQGKKLLLLHDYITHIEGRTYMSWDCALWDKADLREALNNKFYYRAFTDKERELILLTSNVTSGAVANRNRYTLLVEGEKNYSINTNDNVFVLSSKEVKKLIPNKLDRMKTGTEWWLRDASPYWTSYGDIFRYNYYYVTENGSISNKDSKKPTEIRPAMWVKCE